MSLKVCITICGSIGVLYAQMLRHHVTIAMRLFRMLNTLHLNLLKVHFDQIVTWNTRAKSGPDSSDRFYGSLG